MLIRCGDDGLAPMAIICKHLMDGRSREWIEVPNPDEECSDYLCPECFEVGPDDLAMDDLAAVCMHCARKLREGCRR